MNTKLFLQISLHLYGTRRRVVLVCFRQDTTRASEHKIQTRKLTRTPPMPRLQVKSCRFALNVTCNMLMHGNCADEIYLHSG